MATPTRSSKTMSDRLMNMKFMQRGSASPAVSEPPTKRQRLANNSQNTSPASTTFRPASTIEDKKQPVEMYNRGETKWYLSLQAPQKPAKQAPFQIVSAGYSQLDSANSTDKRSFGRDSEDDDEDDDDDDDDDDDEDEEVEQNTIGRKSFGNFNKAIESRQDRKPPSPSASHESGSDESDGDVSDTEDNVNNEISLTSGHAGDLARADRRAQKRAANSELDRMGQKRRKKAVDLNGISSISSGGYGGGDRGASRDTSVVCYQCNGKGHRARDCPKKQKSSRKSY